MNDKEILEKLHKLSKQIDEKNKENEKLMKRLRYIKKELLLNFDTQSTIFHILDNLKDIDINGLR